MNLAFDVVFAVFALAIIALAVVAIRWGVRRDRAARAQQAHAPAPGTPPGTAPVTPGSTPRDAGS
jgi:hypothetical protein